jgi:sensor histidine kinase YesM
MIFHKTKDAGLGLLVCVLVDILNYLILHRLLRRPVILEQKRRQDGWMFMCIVPALFYLVELVLFMQQIKAYDSPGIVIAGVLVLVIMAVSYRLETMIWLGQERDNRLLRDKEVMETYSSSLEKELAARHMADDRTAMMRHDMRHYVAMIASLMSEKKYEEVVEVLKDMNGRLDESTPKKYCTNVYLNAVLAQYDDLTKAEGIAFSVKMETPDNLQISTIDLASTISNLLNNAVNGCRKISNETERVIKIRSHVVKNQFMVEVSNTFNGVIHLDEESGLPLSDGGSEHGYGMRSVSAFAEKNGGMFDFSVEDNKFYARLLLPLQNL